MAKITFDRQLNIDIPTLLLQNRNFDTLGKINDASSLEYKENFNGANELSFTVYKTINGKRNVLWDLILNNKIIFIPEFEERFVISVSVSDEGAVSKSVTGMSLCESELSQINLYDMEINTGDELGKDGKGTTFYNDEDTEHSLLHRLFEKAPHYSIAHVDKSLRDFPEIKTFTISGTDLYSELTGEIAQEFNCIFIFNSMDRTVSVYDLYNTCGSCGFRGDFSDKCPECGSMSFGGQYGEDTSVFISGENLADSINLEPDMDSFKNCFYVEGGDDVITSAIRSINPNGSNYIYYFSDDILNDMPESLVNALKAYNDKYDFYNSDREYELGVFPAGDYNSVVEYVKEKFMDDENIPERFNPISDNGVLTGYPATTAVMYEATDLYYFLKSSMMPTINTEGEGLEASLKNIVDGFAGGFSGKDGTVIFKNEIAIRNNTSATRKSVERVIEKAARLFFNTAYYSLQVNTSSYAQASPESGDGSWTGSFKLTSLTGDDENGNKKFCESEQIVLSVSSDAELFTQQEIYRAVTGSQKFKEEYKDVMDLKTDDKIFKDRLGYYSLDELNNLNDMFEICKDTIMQTDEVSDMDDELLGRYSQFFSDRTGYIAEETKHRENQLKYVLKIYNCLDDNTDTGVLNAVREEVNNTLDIKNYFMELFPDDGLRLWNTFCSYRSEDKYSNSSYTSDALTDSGIVKRAGALLDTAKKELYKAGNIQYSISSTISNLLALKEFYPLKDKFAAGNWIRVGINERVYKLRLLSYRINFDEIESIDVEFSTVEKIYNGYSDVESVIKSASSIAGSYSGLVQQVAKTSSAADKVNNLVSSGLNATRTKFVDSDNEEIVIDNHGILGRRYDYVTDSYDKHQFRILSNGLYITSDNWGTINTGIGRISYHDPVKDIDVDDYGIIANTVVGNLFIGKEFRIYGDNNCIVLDEHGITLEGGVIRWASQIKQEAVDGLSEELKAWKDWTGEDGEFGKYKEEVKMQFDGKSDCTYGGAEPPQNPESGDLWFCTDGSGGYGRNKAYMYDGSAWKEANGVPDSVWDIADGKSSIFVEKPCKRLSDTDLNYYHAGDFWVLENDMVLNGKEYKEGSIMVALKDSAFFDESHWTEKLRYTDDSKAESVESELNKYKNEIKNFQEKVDNSLSATVIDNDYIISPKIGGGHLYISKKGYGSVIIDPYQEKSNGYIFAVKNSDDNVVMGVDTDGMGTFSGDVKIGYTPGCPESPYNCIIDSKGFRIGVGNGGTTYAFKVDSGGNVTAAGSLNLCNSLLYNPKKGLGLNNRLTVFNEGKLIFREESWNSETDNEQGSCGYIAPITDSAAPGIGINGMNINLSASRTLTLESYASHVIVKGGLKLENDAVYLSRTLNNSGDAATMETVSCKINVNDNGQCVITNDFGTSVAVMNGSLSVPSKDDGKTDLGRSNARWKDVYSSTSLITTSDMNYKKETAPLNEKYERFFMKLMPVSFLFKDGDSGRTHIGFISQDVETAMLECGLTDLDFAGFCRDVKRETCFDENGTESYRDVLDEDGKPVYIYSLRYEEFIPLNTHMLQKCINKINDLENRILNLQGGNF